MAGDYEQAGDLQNAIRCLERVLLQATRYGVPGEDNDEQRLAPLREVWQARSGTVKP